MKKILIFSVLGLGALTLLSAKKFTDIKSVVNNLKVKLKSISLPNFGYNTISFFADFILENPTQYNFNITESTPVIIKKIDVFSKAGKHIATAPLDIATINLEAFSSRELKNIKITGNTTNIFLHLVSNLNNIKENLVFQTEIEVLNQTYTI